MELYQLRSFAAIAEAGQLTRAAEKLHVSQPALSAQLKALEEELKVPLFVRTATGMVLTPGGKKLLAAANKVIAAAEALRREARLMSGEVAGKARIGTLSDPDFARLGEFMAAAMARHPLIEIELHQEVTGIALNLVLEGELDASFYYGELGSREVAGLPLRDIQYRVVAPAAWAPRIAEAGWEDIAAMQWIIPPAVSSHHKLAHRLLGQHGVEPKRVLEADTETLVSALVTSGVGMALMREDVALEKAREGEVVLWDDARIGTTLWFIYRRDRQDDPLIRALVSVQETLWDLAPAGD